MWSHRYAAKVVTPAGPLWRHSYLESRRTCLPNRRAGHPPYEMVVEMIDALASTAPSELLLVRCATATAKQISKRSGRRCPLRTSCSRSFHTWIEVRGSASGRAFVDPTRAGTHRRAARAGSRLPVHILTDWTIGLGKVAHDYLR